VLLRPSTGLAAVTDSSAARKPRPWLVPATSAPQTSSGRDSAARATARTASAAISNPVPPSRAMRGSTAAETSVPAAAAANIANTTMAAAKA